MKRKFIGLITQISTILHFGHVYQIYGIDIKIPYFRPFGEEEVVPLLDRVSERGKTIGEGIQRSQNFLQNYVPKVPGQARELSPDLLELQAEIDAIR